MKMEESIKHKKKKNIEVSLENNPMNYQVHTKKKKSKINDTLEPQMPYKKKKKKKKHKDISLQTVDHKKKKREDINVISNIIFNNNENTEEIIEKNSEIKKKKRHLANENLKIIDSDYAEVNDESNNLKKKKKHKFHNESNEMDDNEITNNEKIIKLKKRNDYSLEHEDIIKEDKIISPKEWRKQKLELNQTEIVIKNSSTKENKKRNSSLTNYNENFEIDGSVDCNYKSKKKKSKIHNEGNEIVINEENTKYVYQGHDDITYINDAQIRSSKKRRKKQKLELGGQTELTENMVLAMEDECVPTLKKEKRSKSDQNSQRFNDNTETADQLNEKTNEAYETNDYVESIEKVNDLHIIDSSYNVDGNYKSKKKKSKIHNDGNEIVINEDNTKYLYQGQADITYINDAQIRSLKKRRKKQKLELDGQTKLTENIVLAMEDECVPAIEKMKRRKLDQNSERFNDNSETTDQLNEMMPNEVYETNDKDHENNIENINDLHISLIKSKKRNRKKKDSNKEIPIPYMSEKNIKMLQDLNVEIDFEIPPLHKYGSHSEKCDAGAIKTLGYNRSPFTTSEIELIMNNFQELCKGIDDPDPMAFIYMRHNVIKLEKIIKILQFLGYGLPDRPLHSIFSTFKKIYSWHKTGSFTEEENEIILKFMSTTDENNRPFHKLVEQLNRSRKAIVSHYNNAVFKKPGKPVYTNQEIVRLIMKKGNFNNINDLKDLKVDTKFFRSIAKDINIGTKTLIEKWNVHIYVELFAKVRNIIQMKKKLIKMLIEDNVNDFKNIDKSKYKNKIEGTTNEFITYLIRLLKLDIGSDENILDNLKNLSDNIRCCKCDLPDTKKLYEKEYQLDETIEKSKKKKRKHKKK